MCACVYVCVCQHLPYVCIYMSVYIYVYESKLLEVNNTIKGVSLAFVCMYVCVCICMYVYMSLNCWRLTTLSKG
jgi:hypothetical protein